jgi:putative radical SAM enzyme (TIGR03279 family)
MADGLSRVAGALVSQTPISNPTPLRFGGNCLQSPIRAGNIQSVEPNSLAASLGLRPGDEILAVNGHPVEDVIDVQFYAAEDEVEITFRRDGHRQFAIRHRPSGQPLGLEFTHPTFDVDIRRCNNLCPFCFVLQTAPRMRRTLYIKDDDYRYSFLFGHFVTLTNLSERDWRRIEQQRLSPLYVSVHSTDLENRRACLANPQAPDILAQLKWLAARGIEMHTQLVITPGLNDGAWMQKSIRDLARFYPAVRSVSVVPVGLTRHHKYGHRPNTLAEAERVLAAVDKWQARFLKRLGVRFVYPTDEWFLITGRPIPPRRYYDGLALQENGLGMVRGFLEDWRRVKAEVSRFKVQDSKGKGQRARHKAQGARANVTRHSSLVTRRATLVTATLFAPVLRKTTAEFNKLAGAELEVVPVLNERLGHTITVAGLLMGQDVIAQLRDRGPGEFVVLPRVMFDHPQGISLDDVSPLQIARALGRPVFLADALGDVLDAFTGENVLRFDPASDVIPPEVMKAGGWAVEKYL